MYENIIYISIFFISGFILSILKYDLQKCKIKLYNQITNTIWIKVYALMNIVLIHAFWFFNELFLKENTKSICYIYGFTYYLFIPYLIYLVGDLRDKINGKERYDKNDIVINETKKELKISIASEKINKYLNYLISIYFFLIILMVLIPNDVKENIIMCIKGIISKCIAYLASIDK